MKNYCYLLKSAYLKPLTVTNVNLEFHWLENHIKAITYIEKYCKCIVSFHRQSHGFSAFAQNPRGIGLKVDHFEEFNQGYFYKI